MNYEARFNRLMKAVSAVYFAALWTADRPCDEKKLWTELRDAAGFKKGFSTEVLAGRKKLSDLPHP